MRQTMRYESYDGALRLGSSISHQNTPDRSNLMTRNDTHYFVRGKKPGGPASFVSASSTATGKTHKRFLQVRETIQQTLIRKFKTKYIDMNPEFVAAT